MKKLKKGGIFFAIAISQLTAQRRLSRIGAIEIEIGGPNWLMYREDMADAEKTDGSR